MATRHRCRDIWKADSKLVSHLNSHRGILPEPLACHAKGQIVIKIDVDSALPVPVVNQTLAHQFFAPGPDEPKESSFPSFDRTFLISPNNTYFDRHHRGCFRTPRRRRRKEARGTRLPEAFRPHHVAGLGNPLQRARLRRSLLSAQERFTRILAVDPHVALVASDRSRTFYRGKCRFLLVSRALHSSPAPSRVSGCC